MKKYSFILVFILILSSYAAAQASIGDIQVTDDTILSTGQYGIIVDIENITLKGYAAQKIYLIVSIYEGENQSCYPHTLTELYVSKNSQSWEQLELEIPYDDIYSCINTGQKQVLIICSLMPEHARDQSDVLPGGSKYLQTTLNIAPGKDTITQFGGMLSDKTKVLIQELKEDYGLTIYILDNIQLDEKTKKSYTFDFNKPNDAYRLNRAILVFYKFISTLPGQFIKNSPIEGVLFINSVYYENLGQVGGGYSKDLRYIFLSNLRFTREFIAHVFLHELFHVLEIKYHWEGYFKKTEWLALNPPGTEYSSVDQVYGSQDNIYFARKEYPSPGFVTGYCFADPYQDRAETFSYMLSPFYHPRLKQWIKQDNYLKAKVEFIKTDISTIFPSLTAFFSSIGL